jgi:CDP-paratose synthetase
LQLINADSIEIEKFVASANIDVIIHAATDYGRNGISSAKVLESNLILPIQLLEGAIKGQTKLFINTDSYFNKENMAYSYLLNYSLSKKSLLIWLKYYSNRIKIANMVLEHIYGEYDNPSKFVENMIQQVAIKKVNRIDLTYGNQKRDFVYVKDVVDAYLKVIQYSEKNQFRFNNYDVGTGKAIQIKEFVCLIKELSNSNTQLNFGAIPYRDDEIMNSIADIVDLKNIGWDSKISVETGIKKIIDNYNSTIKLYE